MSELETLLPTLESIPAHEVDEPDLPMAVALQEAHDLHAALVEGDGWDRVIAVGLEPAVVTALPDAIAAARQAQSQWTVERGRKKPRAQVEHEQQGVALRRGLVAACRWNLRHDARAQGVLDSIVKGDGVPDLVQDLLDLATLIDRDLPHFDADETFDASAQVEAARSQAEQITEGLAGRRADGDQRTLKQQRDRAYTHLDGIVSDIRSAGRYAFRDDPRRAAMFASRYLRQRRRAARRRRMEVVQTVSQQTG